MKRAIGLLVILLSSFIGCNDGSIADNQENHRPVIFSLTAFPDVVQTSDSVIVVCYAMDPDLDTLVYDWICQGTVRIKGARANETWLYNTFENSRVFYAPDSEDVVIDSFFVQCYARDRRGMSDGEIVTFRLANPNP